ncbi:trimeric intracellular cation channel family protein [Arthrobacter bambusae]|uniref:trimeric intracellular cation channel family protein n=1 Tax=Arthrobacter bambusae TaxID=1338426 RepID=UPI002787174A|nr:trimeric intracellular cation channel family protein [Arthrobacter bambusae]MDQ0031312.1 putative membrane protein YeiH [Arthrobacter bambusae]MDQ0099535.1 putative membrane protein YeiH [Arthrobacter bambusae]
MFTFDLALVWLDLAGVFFFAVSGSLLAAKKQFDIIGSLLLASLVGLGGGVIRDIVINAGPPAAFTNPVYLVPPVLAAVLVYFLFSSIQRFTSLLTLFDAGGLALFCITGTLKALAAGLNPVAAILLGVTTAVGGGLLRDITANEIPTLFNARDLYALPAFTGAALTALLWTIGAFNGVTAGVIAAWVFAFRVVAWRWGWRVPLAVRGWHRAGVSAGAESRGRD